uniref:Uncharacterized protein n=1 Tax=Pisum sativum TaxID=3888 RepID=V9H1E2_PEA|nr:hypothetical protein 52 - garden pea chloroplast [Pisum sativum]CAA25832.1 hypothetical protein [Pisum sativum]
MMQSKSPFSFFVRTFPLNKLKKKEKRGYPLEMIFYFYFYSLSYTKSIDILFF